MKRQIALILLVFFSLFILPYDALAVKVVIDPGHGGKDPGAIGLNGLQEKMVNLDISLYLEEELRQRGYETAMTRTVDEYISLQDRVNFANQAQADLFVSVHANSYDSWAQGTLVLYYDDAYPQKNYPASPQMAALTAQSKELAEKVLYSFIDKAGTANKGIVPSAVYVVRRGIIPSILVETAFLSNAQDILKLSDGEIRKRMAVGIAKGIEAYLPAIFPDMKGHWAWNSVMRLQAEGIVTGERNLYYPERNLTRAELLTILDRLFSFDQALQTPSVTQSVYDTHLDLNHNHWAYPTLIKALALGYLQGYPDHTLRPNQPVTRAETAVLFESIINFPKETNSAAPDSTFFNDVPTNSWYALSVNRLKESKIINGVTPDRFEPERNITRAEIASLVDQYLNSR